MQLVSVVVSCYNQKDYIVECLDSILSQEVDFDYELIISDDCSTDGTREILQTYSCIADPRINLLLRDVNVGAAANYHGLHNMVKGDVVFHFDGDDVMLPGKLQEQFDVFMEHPDVNIVMHKAIYFSDDGQYCSETQFPDHSAGELFFFSVSELARWGTIAVHGSYAYRRSSRTAVIDREFMEWFFAMDSLINGGKGAFINRAYIKYRCNVTSSSYLSSRNGKIKAYNLYFADLYEYFGSHKNLRLDLYANFLVTALAMCKSVRMFPMSGVGFFLKNIKYFRPSIFIETFKVRMKVGPKESIR